LDRWQHHLTIWGYLTRLVKRWDDIEAVMANQGPGPWLYALNEGGLTQIM
jgi:hypothetical protein